MKHFTLLELTVTHSGLPNIPNEEQVKNLKIGVENLLDPLREMYGKPIIVNSGFRTPAVNKAVNGSPTSNHMTGQAFDITCEDNMFLFQLIKKHFAFDQLINEYDYSWVHVSYRGEANRHQIFSLP